MKVTFFGVRGSTPCHGPDVSRTGGNTSCVSVAVPGNDPILLDLGTGARYFGLRCRKAVPFRGHCLLSHFHWDHIQGLPFFPPLLSAGSLLDLHAPPPDEHDSVADLLDSMLRAPLFPVGLDDLPGELRCHEHADDEFMIGSVHVTTRLIPHIGNTLGFRLDWDGRSVAYLSDHQQPGVDDFDIDRSALELCAGADLVIHDAQYTADEFEHKQAWGHCTIDYAIAVAAEAGATAVALYHHDPCHDDTMLDAVAEAHRGRRHGPDVLIAREGHTVTVGP